MKKWFGVILTVAVVGILIGIVIIPAIAQGGSDKGIPTSMSYQGYLTDDNGDPVPGPVDITFSIYTSTGTPIWAEKYTGVNLNNGLFSVELGGNGSPMQAAIFDGDRFLGIKVDDDPEMNPRQKITSVGYALVAEYSNTANSAYALDAPDGSPLDAVYVDNDGNVGIGLITPSSRLDVLGTITGDGLTIDGPVSGSGFTGWDSDSSNDLTTSTSLTGDVTGNWDSTVVGDDSHNHSDATLADNISIDNGRFYAPSGSGNVGIGTDTPTTGLEVVGEVKVTPANPLHVGAISDNGSTELSYATSVYVSGEYAYVASRQDDGVEILDISDPTNPTHVGAITDNGTYELDGARDIHVSGTYAYVASYNDDGVEILDISDPANPTHVGCITDDATTLLDGASGIYIYGNYAYVTSLLEFGVEILDISDPTNPTHVGSIADDATTELAGAEDIYISGNYAYVASAGDNGVEILDISDPANPTHVGAISDDGTTALDYASSIYVSGKYAYVASLGDNGVEILDISDPANPTHMGCITDNGTTELAGAVSIYVSGRYAYVASQSDHGVEILDISDPANPAHVGAITDAGDTELWGACSIFVSGKYAYVASAPDCGVEILDIGGINAASASFGDIAASNINASGGLNVGQGGIYTAGAIEAATFTGDGSGLRGVPSDNLGNHLATQNIELGTNYLSGDGGNEGIYVDSLGAVGIGTDIPASELDVDGTISADSIDIAGSNHFGSDTIYKRISISSTPADGTVIWSLNCGSWSSGFVEVIITARHYGGSYAVGAARKFAWATDGDRVDVAASTEEDFNSGTRDFDIGYTTSGTTLNITISGASSQCNGIKATIMGH